MAAIDKVKILVIGDSGVGKTSLVHLICHGTPITKPSWTIGCSVEVTLHEFKAGTPSEKTFFVELWEVGGWAAHQSSRSVFYGSVQGIILVHDLMNRKSKQNLRKWLAEVLSKRPKGGVSFSTQDDFDYDPEQFVDSSIPMLIIGTKLDCAVDAESMPDKKTRQSSSLAEECHADEISLDCTDTKHLAPFTGNSVKLSRFFDKVIERKYYKRDISNQHSSFTTYQDREKSKLVQTSHGKQFYQD